MTVRVRFPILIGKEGVPVTLAGNDRFAVKDRIDSRPGVALPIGEVRRKEDTVNLETPVNMLKPSQLASSTIPLSAVTVE